MRQHDAEQEQHDDGADVHHDLRDRHELGLQQDVIGGLSGAPVFEASNRVIAQLRSELGSAYPIVGVGGVMSGADAVAKREVGADLVQVYTGLI